MRAKEQQQLNLYINIAQFCAVANEYVHIYVCISMPYLHRYLILLFVVVCNVYVCTVMYI